eukprot:CAMPEP_0170642944 /NCGR_PEP_ID=MMETSP0224-20130122/41606_1 /TAXON_ID=285029 /ORGANISM="Togula jolla, Strain CCCM 725" /LENGTH=71 /DNA_ID=CAMNT_0010973707 /DNA_START=454 /DNA_END=666 /DNA_ORIENTATION=-
MDEDCRSYLLNSDHKVEILVHWIQVTIVQGTNSGVLAPPAVQVLTTLSSGVVIIMNARKINELPFPHGYSQ